MSSQQANGPALALELRKSLRELALQSQQLEHHFYAEIRHSVATSSTELADAVSEILQSQLPTWPAPTLQRFAACSGIPASELEAWRSLRQKVAASAQAAAKAATELANAKKNQSKYSGMLWGAKTGFEREHAEASAIVAAAERDKVNLEQAARSVRDEAVAKGSNMLEWCMQHAAELAANTEFGARIKTILLAAATAADTGVHRHTNQQRRMLQEMKQIIAKLETVY